MKKLITLVFVLVLNVMTVSANNFHIVDDLPKAVKKALKVLSDTRFEEALEKEVVVKVVIKINADNEIVVLHVDTKNQAIKKFISNKLNYNKLEYSKLEKGNEYSFLVTFKPQN